MGEEKREFERGALSEEQPNAILFLRSSNGIYAITRIIDISLTGAGIESRFPINPGERVVLKYRGRDCRFAIDGTVAWCKSGKDRKCSLGIAFARENGERNALFFLAMRKYLDDFDGITMDA